MTIKFNENEKTIEIKDRLKFQYFMFKIALIITIINSFIFPVFVLEKAQLEWMGSIWIILGITSVGVFIYHILKKTTSEKLNLTEIISLTEKQLFGRKMYCLKLKNGKKRDLMEMEKESDIIAMKKLFGNIGIQTS